MSTLTYGGITMGLFSTERYDEETVLDDSGTDILFKHVSIQVHAIINQNYLPGAGGENPGVTFARISSTLQTPRLELIFTDNNGTTLVHTTGVNNNAANAVSDINNGPFPHLFSIKQISDATYHVMFHVDTFFCPAGATPPLILEHRWEERMGIDSKFIVSYTRTGKIYLAAQQPPMSDTVARNASMVPLRVGFRRDNVEYIFQENGLALKYTVRDVQCFRSSPPPAVDARGQYYETSPYGAIKEIGVSLHLWGDPTGDQIQLLNTAIIIAVAKIGIPVTPPPFNINIGGPGSAFAAWNNSAIGAGVLAYVRSKINSVVNERLNAAIPTFTLKNFIARQELYSNEVEVQIIAQVVPPQNPDAASAATTLDLTAFSTPPGYSPRGGIGPTKITPGQTNTVINSELVPNLTLWAAMLNEPCLTQALSPGQIGSGTAPPLVVSTTPTIGSGNVTAYNPQPNGLYTDYFIRITQRTGLSTAQSPNATPNAPISQASMVAYCSPVQQMVVQWTAECVAGPPTAPNPWLSDSNVRLLKSFLFTDQLDLRPDGQSLAYRLTGEYWYGIIDPTQSVLLWGVVPWLNSQLQGQFPVTSMLFANGLIDQGGGPIIPNGMQNVLTSVGSGSGQSTLRGGGIF